MSRILIRTSFAAVLGLLGAVAVAGESATARPASFPAPSPLVPWRAVAASGGVEARNPVETDGAWLGVQRGDELPPRTELRTGDRGRATLTRSGSLLIVDPKSVLELPEARVEGLQTSVLQTSGSVLYRVDGRKHKHFEVVTPYLVAGVKGTEFLVTVNDSYTAVTVSAGLVEITDVETGDVREVGAGQAMLRPSDEEGIELVDRGERGSARLRKESRRLEQMERRDPEVPASDSMDKQGGSGNVAESKEKGGKDEQTSGAADALLDLDEEWDNSKDVFSTNEKQATDTKEQADDLLEELIREETHNGLLPVEKKHSDKDSDDSVSSGSSTGSGSGSGSSGSGSGSGSGSSGSGSGSGSGSSGSGSGSGSGSSGSGSSGSGSSGSGSSGSGSSGSGSSGSGSSGSGSSH